MTESEESAVDMDTFLSSSRSWAVGRLASRSHRSLQSDAGDASPFVDFRPPARDSVSLPPHMLYVTAGLVLVVLATYAIVGHLINDLLHDLAGTRVTRVWWRVVLCFCSILSCKPLLFDNCHS